MYTTTTLTHTVHKHVVHIFPDSVHAQAIAKKDQLGGSYPRLARVKAIFQEETGFPPTITNPRCDLYNQFQIRGTQSEGGPNPPSSLLNKNL